MLEYKNMFLKNNISLNYKGKISKFNYIFFKVLYYKRQYGGNEKLQIRRRCLQSRLWIKGQYLIRKGFLKENKEKEIIIKVVKDMDR